MEECWRGSERPRTTCACLTIAKYVLTVLGASPWLANTATNAHNEVSDTGNGFGIENLVQNAIKRLTPEL